MAREMIRPMDWDDHLKRAKTALAEPGRRASWPKGQAKRGREYPFERPDLRSRMLAHLRKGYPTCTIAMVCGVSGAVWRRWEKRGDAGEEPFASWFTEVRQARADGQLGLLDMVRAAGEGTRDQHGVWRNQWQAARWLIERADPSFLEQPVQEIRMEVESSAQSTIKLEGLSVEELEDLYRLTAKAEACTEDQVVPEDRWVEAGEPVPTDLESSCTEDQPVPKDS